MQHYRLGCFCQLCHFKHGRTRGGHVNINNSLIAVIINQVSRQFRGEKKNKQLEPRVLKDVKFGTFWKT
jgi:hypothetical protein